MSNKKGRDSQVILLVVLVAALGGGMTTFIKIAIEVFPPFTFLFLRFLIAVIILVPLFIKAREKVSRKDLWPITLVSLLGMGNVVFFSFGIKHTTAIVSQTLYAAVPIIAALASFLILGASISRKKILGVLFGFIGVLIIVLVPSFREPADGIGTILGNILVLVAVVSYSLYTVYSKKLHKKYSPLVVTMAMVVTTFIIQTLLIPFEVSSYAGMWNEITVKSLIGLLYAGLIGTVLYFILYQKVIKKASPLVASMVFYLQPVFSFVWAFFLLGERLTLSLVIGGILALVGAGLVTGRDV